MLDLDQKGLRDQETLKFVDQETIQMGETTYKVIATGIHEQPGPGVAVEVLKFKDAKQATKMDAARITIEPGQSTPIEYFNDQRIFIDAPTAGNGTYLSISPEGEVFSCDFDADNGLNPGLVVYGQGWVNTWIAGNKGLQLLEVCVPPFVDDGGIIKGGFKDEKVGERVIPASFKIAYKVKQAEAK